MGKINRCLKCLFIFFNFLFAVCGSILIYIAIQNSIIQAQYTTVGAPGLGWIWVFAIGVLGVSCLGIYAGCTEKELSLKIFVGFMAVGMVVMLGFGIYAAVTRNNMKDAFTNAASEASKTHMQSEDFRTSLKMIQAINECCGLSRAEDWGSEIPQSCACRGLFGRVGFGECKPRPQDTTGPDQIYAKPCGQYLFSLIDPILKIYLYIMFGFAVTAMLGLLVSMLMLHQVKQVD